ncbi:MAG: 50S ribosomal protein L11 methyltransferase [Clostridiales bacterium]|nr:50S ribosomal protein L11 methyltransferase [Clostridiales bacterium]
MKWLELTVSTTDEGADIVAARLSMLGINEVSVVQGHDAVERIMNETVKYWDYADDAALDKKPAVQAYLAIVPENDGIEEKVRASMAELKTIEPEIGIDLGTLAVETKEVDEEDWANNWKAYFKPISVGDKLIVCPTWEKAEDTGDRAVLRIDPGMAFGTGNHHTTRMCLELIEKYMKKGASVIDIGCGSGILSASAVLMGAEDAVAIDVDPVATKVAAETAELNGIDLMKYTVYTGDVLTDKQIREAVTKKKFDVVLANIVANVIIALAPLVPKLMHRDSVFISSGIIDDRLDDVVAALEENGLKVNEIRVGDDWRAIEATLK